MAKVPAIVPVSDLRQDAAGVLKKLRDSDEPVFITQRGRAAAVLMSIDAFERSENQRELLLLARREVRKRSPAGSAIVSTASWLRPRLLAETRKAIPIDSECSR